MIHKQLFFTWFLFGILILSNCSGIKVNPVTKNPHQYKKVEMDIHLNVEFNNPHNTEEISLDMIVFTPSGNMQTVPCFHYSGESNKTSIWKVRYMPTEFGDFQYHYILNQKGNKTHKTKTRRFYVTAKNGKGILHVNDLWTLKYDNGEVFRGIGQNICWESRDTDDSKHFQKLHEDSRFNYEYMVRKLAKNGGNFFRTWMIFWNLPVDWKTVKNNSRYTNTEALFNESGAKKMDRLVELCDSLGVHIMVTLDSHAGLLGEGWELSPYNIDNGGTANTQEEFFTLESTKKQYKNKLRYMIARYGYSPAMGALEFFNEIDNVMYNQEPGNYIKDEIVTSWHKEMSTYLKQVDPYNHIVTTSVSHREVAGLNDLENLDINQQHIYRHTDKIPELIQARVEKYRKPFVIGEFGYEWDWSKNFNEFAEEMDADFKKGLWYGLFNPTPILPMSWWWEFFENRNMMCYFKNLQLVNNEMLSSGQGQFEQIDVKINEENSKIYSVKCGSKSYTFVLCEKDANTLTLNFPDYINLKSGLEYFDCENGNKKRLENINISGNSITLHEGKYPLKTGIIIVSSVKME